jgi:hypothetical protein
MRDWNDETKHLILRGKKAAENRTGGVKAQNESEPASNSSQLALD